MINILYVILIIGGIMKIEKWNYKGSVIDVPVFDDNEIETNDYEDISKESNELEDTIDLSEVLEDIENE